MSADQDCVSGTLERSALITKGMLVDAPVRPALEHSGEQIIYPNINFNCSGKIVAISFATLENSTPAADQYPEVQLWKEDGASLYTNVGTVPLAAAKRSKHLNIFQLHLQEPITFKRGYVIGLHLPRRESSRLVVQFQPPVSKGTDTSAALSFNSDLHTAMVVNLSNSQLMQDFDIPMMFLQSGMK